MSKGTQRKNKWLKISFWGPIVGIIGGLIGIIGGGQAIMDRYFPPSIEVVDILPVFVFGEETREIAGSKFKTKLRGVSLIAHIKSEGRSISISGVEVSGKRYLTFNEWLPYYAKDGDSMDNLALKYKASKSYYLVSFSGWLTDSKAPVRISEHEEALLRFTITDPSELYRPKLIDLGYIGSDNESRTPNTRRFHPDWQDFFVLRSNGTVESIRDEINKGLMKIEVIAGSKRVSVPSSKILKPKNITLNNWQEKSMQYLYSDRYN